MRDSYKSERVTARKSMPIDTNPQPRLRNTSCDGLGGGGEIATRKCIGTFGQGGEGGVDRNSAPLVSRRDGTV